MSAERLEELAQALDDLYNPEGVGTWWQGWLEADPDRRAHMVRAIIAAAGGAFA